MLVEEMDEATQKRVETWLQGGYDEETKAEIRRLLEDNPQEVIDSFYTTLKFGTGGLRGLMGNGTNRMNVYTVRATTQGLANYINSQESGKEHSVFIGYDCRHRSRLFAEETARVFAGNGIRVYLTKEERPTPLVSFGCRYKGCTSAVMITASHNPPEYNGYKVYWDDGAQILPPHDKGIIDEVNRVERIEDVVLADLNSPLIEEILEEVDTPYLEAIKNLRIYPTESDLKVVFANLHGTGITLMPSVLERFGITRFISVEAQEKPDGSFPTVKSPNPEEPTALKLGIDVLLKEEGDILLATDPDADRLGVVVNHRGRAEILDGNQVACLCLKYVLEGLKKQDRLPKNGAVVKTIVTSELFDRIAKSYDVACYSTLTGFKYIAEKIRSWEEGEHTYLFGGEESYGYLVGDIVRDKDGLTSGALVAEAAAMAKKEGKTLVDELFELYKEYGVYRECLLAIDFPETKEGREQMASAMQTLKQSPADLIKNRSVVCVEDYEKGTRSYTDPEKEDEPLALPKSNVLRLWFSDNTKLVVRPSGTEPKIKVYAGVCELASTHLEQGSVKALDRARRFVRDLAINFAKS